MPTMQHPPGQQQSRQRGGPQRRSSSNGSNPPPPPPPQTPSCSSSSSATTSTSTAGPPLPSLLPPPGSTVPRTARRPGTSSGSAAADGLLGPAVLFRDPFQDDPPPPRPSPSRRAFAFGFLGSAGGGGDSLLPPRKKSLGRKPSLDNLLLPASHHHYTWQQQQHNKQQHSPPPVSRFRSLRRRANSAANLRDEASSSSGAGAALLPHLQLNSNDTTPPKTDRGNPPALPPEYAKLSCSASPSREQHTTTSVSPRPWSRTHSSSMDSGRMNTRQGTQSSSMNGSLSAGGGMMPPPSASAMGMQTEAAMVHQHIQEMANKRISTLEYLRKAHEGRVYWFNTLLFDKPDLARMTYFDSRRLARRATNYLLLGLSLPTVIDLNASSPLEFLRSLNLLLTEFDAFQSLHPESGAGASGLGRARIPNLNVFRRATPSSKGRRSSSATNEVLYEDDGGSTVATTTISSSAGGSTSVMNGLGGSASVVSFGQSEADLLPGEEYVHLLTPSLPFDPDFFETFATLCDVLIDAYTRLLGMLPTPRECNAVVAELFTKADARVRKIIVQGVVKEFEDTSRNGVRTEVANVGKIVLGGLM